MSPNHLLLIALLFLCSCANDSTTPPYNPKPNSTLSIASHQKNAILIFKKEQLIEIWEDGKKTKTSAINLDPRYPVGIFDAQQTADGLLLSFPNKFYQEKNYQLKFQPNIVVKSPDFSGLKLKDYPVYIFPNDARNGDTFVANFSSPHWMAALYAKMNLHLREFK